MEDELTRDLSKTYIYQGEEYILTGRSATKEADAAPVAQRPARKSSRRSRKPSTGPDVMVEIKPAPRTALRGVVVAPSMTKELQWVKQTDLYVVEDVIADDYWDESEETNESIDSSS